MAKEQKYDLRKKSIIKIKVNKFITKTMILIEIKKKGIINKW